MGDGPDTDDLTDRVLENAIDRSRLRPGERMRFDAAVRTANPLAKYSSEIVTVELTDESLREAGRAWVRVRFDGRDDTEPDTSAFVFADELTSLGLGAGRVRDFDDPRDVIPVPLSRLDNKMAELASELGKRRTDPFEIGDVIRWTSADRFTYAAIRTGVGWYTTARDGNPFVGKQLEYEDLVEILGRSEVGSIEVAAAWAGLEL